MKAQGQKFWLFLHKEFERRFLRLGVNSNVGHMGHPGARSMVYRIQARELQTGQEVLLHIGHGGFHAPLFLGPTRRAGFYRKPAVLGKIQIVRMQGGRATQGMVQDRRLTVVDPDLGGHPSKLSKRVLVAAQEVFQRLSQRELKVEPAAVSQNHDKKAQPAASGADD